MKRWYSTGEIAAALGAHPKTVAGWAKAGLIEAGRIGPNGRWRFPPEAVAQAIKAKLAGPQAQPQ